MTREPAFLGVERSLTGRRWVGPGAETERMGAAIAQAHAIEPALAMVLARLGVATDAVPGFLAPTLRDLMPDPATLRDAETAAARLVDAVRRGDRVAIFADYDVDGAASAALLSDWFATQGLRANLYVPDRIDEGYGPNVPAMQALSADNDLIVCVDCGTLAFEPIAAVQGADVLVLDHHQAAAELPAALAVVNPNRMDEDGSLGHLCAAGVVFMVLAAANRALRGEGRAAPDLMAGLDLVALATVADVARLTGLNRAFVRQGLAVMANRQRPGLRAQADAARLDRAPQAYHLGYVLGPRINAGGRIGAADLGARLLTTRDEAEAARIAARLDGLNDERRAIEAEVRSAALAQIDARGDDGALAWAAQDGWHPGVVGIVAARVREATHRPAIVLGLDGGVATGSARSVPGVDIGAVVARARDEGLLLKGGGHAMAAGLTVAAGKLEPAMARISELIARQGVAVGAPGDLRIDSVIMPRAATPELIARLDDAGPYGAGASAPRFAFASLRVAFTRRAGDRHLQLRLADDDDNILEAIAFGAFDTELGAAIDAAKGSRIHAAGRLEIDTWGGRTKAKLRLEDAAIPRAGTP